MIKRVLIVFLLCSLFIIGAAAVEPTSLSIGVYDASNNYAPVSGASVTLSGPSTTTMYTSSDGTAKFTVNYLATYSAQIAKSGYLTQASSIYVNEMPKTAAVYLYQEPKVAIHVVDTAGKSISGATVSVDGKQVGTTDANGLIHAAMTRGAYNTVAVSSPAYIAYSESKYIESDRTTLEIILSKSQTSPLILVYDEGKSPLAGAAVSIDGKLVAYSDTYGRAQLSTYTAGTYLLGVTKDGYQPYSGSIVFSASASDTIVTLNYSNTTVAVLVAAGSKPLANAVVYFGGEVKGITNSTGLFETAAAPGTKIYVTASLDGYTGDSVLYEVKANAVNTITVSMKENVPTTLIGIGALAVIIVLLIIILVVTGRRRGGKKASKAHAPPAGKRDSL
ncbi:MAG: hypothetical protein Q4Q04_03200 [Methanocorpusculum sp.]|nr:hypothetical protein [Methanocorpusculum sp.]